MQMTELMDNTVLHFTMNKTLQRSGSIQPPSKCLGLQYSRAELFALHNNAASKWLPQKTWTTLKDFVIFHARSRHAGVHMRRIHSNWTTSGSYSTPVQATINTMNHTGIGINVIKHSAVYRNIVHICHGNLTKNTTAELRRCLLNPFASEAVYTRMSDSV